MYNSSWIVGMLTYASIKKSLILLVLSLALQSCFGGGYKSDFTVKRSDVANLSFKDINNIKEGKACSSFLDFSVPFLSSLFINKKSEGYYNYLVQSDSLKEDSSLSLAVKRAGIKKIKIIDHLYEVTGFFSRNYCLIVYGE